MATSDFDDLWEGYLSGTLDEADLKMFLDGLDREENQVVSRIGDLFHDRRFSGYSTVAQRDRVFARLMAECKKTNRVVRLRQTFRWVAAASLLAIIATGAWFYLLKTKQSPASAQQKKQSDIAPGGNRALLTLSNGSKIILDSAQNGLLAQQGTAKIIKTDSGSLAYNTNKEKQTDISYNTLSTPRGGQFKLELPDGTKVWLNAASSITFPTAFSGKTREVSVTGEVYFEVVHNEKQPFSVTVNGEKIEDLGTHFNINSYPEEAATQTTLLEGSVRVINKSSRVLLKPGQQAVVANNIDASIKILNDVDLDKVMAWKNGIFEFNNLDFKSIMRQVSRWYDVDIEYKTDPGSASFGGGISKQLTLLQVLHLLEGSGLHLTLENKTIIVNK